MAGPDLWQRLQALDPARRTALIRILDDRGADYGVHPVTSAQRRLWLLAETHPDSAAYNVPYAFRLVGRLDPAVLRAAWDDVVARHEALRTVFVSLDGEPRQLVRAESTRTLVVDEFPDTSMESRHLLAVEHAAAEAGRPFDLATGPLVRARLLRFDDVDAVLLLTLHHIVCDGWSIQIIFDDLQRSYLCRSRGVADEASWPMQYSGYARWQADRASDADQDRLLDHWVRTLTGAPPLVELPTDRPRPAVPAFKGGIELVDWPAELAGAVRTFADGASSTVYQTLLAAFVALLHRYTGQDDLVVGTPAANRTRVETEGTVGMFVNPVPVRARVGADLTFRELTGQIRDAVIDAQAYQDLPFERLVEALQPERGGSYNPLFQVVFTANPAEAEVLELADLRVTRIPSHSGTAKFDLTLSIATDAEALTGWAEYDRDLFDADTVRALLDHLRVLLTAALAEPDRQLAELRLLTAAEEHRLLRVWNTTRLAVEPDRLAHELFEAQADATPDAPAVACGSDRLTYLELDRAANRLAHRLVALGVGAGSVVGMFLDRSVHLAVCALAVWKSGAAYLPLDPAHPQERLRYMAAQAGVAVVVTQLALRDQAPPGPHAVLLDDPEPAGGPDHRPGRRCDPDDLAYIIYTSGSTGRPKGVMVPHRGVCNLAVAMSRVLGVAAGDRLLQFASFSFDAAAGDLLVSLGSGAELWFAPREQLRPGADLVATIRAAGITSVVLPPTVAALMTPAEVPSLHTLIVAGEPCPPELVAAWSADCTVFNGYGPTEASVAATFARLSGWEARVPIGCAIGNVEVYVLDQRMRPVPRGVSGELFIGGAGVARGYLGRPDLTAERFLPDPFGGRAGARLYRTGDVVRYRSDGQLEYVGRTDQQVKLRGLRIELGEIQTVLSQQPGVRVAVVAVQREGQGEARLVAYLVPEHGVEPDPAGLRRAMRELLPEYMIPASFVPVAAIPHTVNGKVDHEVLAGLARSAAGRSAAGDSSLRTETQQRVAKVWREVLGIAEVGLHDNFFDLGGNSLLITRVRAGLERELGRPVATLALFRHPTVDDLAAALTDEAPAETPGPDRTRELARGRQALRARSGRRRAPAKPEGDQ